jgi:RimJ/RimL family protein N-acetyltransferase
MTSTAPGRDDTRATVIGEVARGPRVVLREKRLGDAVEDYRWRTDPELTRFDAARPLAVTYNEFLAVLREEVLYPSQHRRGLAIEDEEGRHIGNIMYYNIDTLRQEAELGVTIGDRSHWSRGYGTEAVHALAEYLLAVRGFRRVHLKTLDWNQRARACFRKAGFVECGRAERAGHAFVLMELRREWLAAAPPATPV